MSLPAGKTPERSTVGRIQSRDLTGEVSKRDLAESVDDRVDSRAGTEIRVVFPGVHGPVEVRLPAACADEQALGIQPGHDRHIGRVRARGATTIKGLHDLSHADFVARPD